MTSRDTYQRHVQRVLRVVHYLWQHPQQETPLAECRAGCLAKKNPAARCGVFAANLGAA